ncbi:MAG: V-containing nitrogenase subunit delta [Rhodopseudomonas palustris]|uniref:nitrogenase n=1 Tax=Rhodopseudomonas palustris TaxID=1076 RepID=A0A933S5Z5_RHOPL|nr:V-containing nitrogenase subunit delta [Rhodopseudomonas palustris]
MSAEQIDQLYNFCQERYLWQFFSRSWDRQENLDGIFAVAAALFAGEEVKRDTPMEKLFYADAKIMVADFQERFPWIAACKPEEIRSLLSGVKDRLTEIAITKSLNGELTHSLY